MLIYKNVKIRSKILLRSNVASADATFLFELVPDGAFLELDSRYGVVESSGIATSWANQVTGATDTFDGSMIYTAIDSNWGGFPSIGFNLSNNDIFTSSRNTSDWTFLHNGNGCTVLIVARPNNDKNMKFFATTDSKTGDQGFVLQRISSSDEAEVFTVNDSAANPIVISSGSNTLLSSSNELVLVSMLDGGTPECEMFLSTGSTGTTTFSTTNSTTAPTITAQISESISLPTTDQTIATIDSNRYTRVTGREIVWISPTVGYYFFYASSNISYVKTTNGGTSWGSTTTLKTGPFDFFDLWYDRWTTGDSGTLIHFAAIQTTVDDYQYFSLNTSDDSISSTVQIHNATNLGGVGRDWSNTCVSICKNIGGNLHVKTQDTIGGAEAVHYASENGGTTWINKALGPTDATKIKFQIFPGGDETDTDDIWCVSLDSSGNLDFDMYDYSANSWSNISSLSTGVGYNNTVSLQIAGVIRFSDGHLMCAVMTGSAPDTVTLYELNSSGIVSQHTVCNSTAGSLNGTPIDISITLDQQSGNIYVAVAGRDTSGTWDITYYLSENGGTTWTSGAGILINDSAPAVWDQVHSCISIGNDGGRWLPGFFAVSSTIALVNLTSANIEIPSSSDDPIDASIVKLAVWNRQLTNDEINTIITKCISDFSV